MTKNQKCGIHIIHMIYKFIKRFLDAAVSAVSLAVLALPMLAIAAAVRLDSPGAPLFWQKRVGIHKSYFMMPKFRTMRIDTPRDKPTHLLENPERWITRVGAFLRRTSLDELPQIMCILTGKMSVIGPRPALWNQFDLILERDKYGANDIRPGLTGWAQVNGRDALEIADKARLDGEYVQKLSFIFDLKCFWRTVTGVISADGVVEGGTGALNKISPVENPEVLQDSDKSKEINDININLNIR